MTNSEDFNKIELREIIKACDTRICSLEVSCRVRTSPNAAETMRRLYRIQTKAKRMVENG